MNGRSRTRLAIVLLVVALVVVLPGGEFAYYLPKLALGALAIAAAAFAPATGRLPRPVVWALVAGAVVLTVAALASASPLSALLGRAPRYEGVLGLSVYAGLLWAGARLLSPAADVADLRLFRRGLAIDSLLIAVLYLLEATGLRPIGGSATDRTGSLLGNATDAGLVGVVLLVLLLGALTVDRSWLTWAGAAAAAVTVGLSESRAAVLAAGVAFVIAAVAVLVRRQTRTRAVVIAIAAVPVAVIVAVLIVPGALHRMTGGSAGKSAQIRLVTWQETLELIGHHWLFGVGPSGFVEAILPFQDQRWADLVGFDSVIDSPHNLVLQTLVAGGVLLLLVALVFAVLLVRVAVRVLRSTPDTGAYLRTVAACAAIAGVLVGMLTAFSTPSILALLLPVLGSVIAVPIVVPQRVKGAPVGRVARSRDLALLWRPVGALLAVVLLAAAFAELPSRAASDAAVAADSSGVDAATVAVRFLRPWDADSISSIAQAAAQGADSASSDASASAMAQIAVTDGLEARGRLGGSSAPTLAAAIGLDHQGESARAIALFGDLIARSRFDASLYVRRGVTLAQSGSIDDAVADFTRALTIDPKNTDATNDLRIVQAAQ